MQKMANDKNGSRWKINVVACCIRLYAVFERGVWVKLTFIKMFYLFDQFELPVKGQPDRVSLRFVMVVSVE